MCERLMIIQRSKLKNKKHENTYQFSNMRDLPTKSVPWLLRPGNSLRAACETSIMNASVIVVRLIHIGSNSSGVDIISWSTCQKQHRSHRYCYKCHSIYPQKSAQLFLARGSISFRVSKQGQDNAKKWPHIATLVLSLRPKLWMNHV